MAPLHSIIIPTYNKCRELLVPCVESVIKYTDMSCVELVIVANGCTDDTKNYVDGLSSIHKSVRLVWFDEAIGYTRATNEGIKVSSGKYIILLNNDVVLLEQQKGKWIEMLLHPFLSADDVGITGPMKELCEYSGMHFILFFCAMISRSAIDRIGMLDEIFSPGYGEDCDMACRAQLNGLRIVQVPDDDSREFYDTSRRKGMFPLWHEGNATFKNWKGGQELLRRNNEILRSRYGQSAPAISYAKYDRGRASISRAMTCDGFMSEAELTWLAEKSLDKNVVIEVGSWHGRSTRALGDNAMGIVYAVDTWDGSANERDTWHQSARSMDGDHAFYEFMQNNIDLVSRGKIVPVRMSSKNASDFFRRNGIIADMIFIDADHTYEGVVSDIKSWMPLLKPGGLLCGHDYVHSDHMKVIEAVDDVLGKVGVAPNTSIWHMIVGGEPMPRKKILCSISTRGRYDTTLPLAINAVAMQELLPDALVIFDDNDNPVDIRGIQHCEYLLRMLDEKGVKWSVVFGEKKGQVHNHRRANAMGYEFVWRVDDDCVPEPDVLAKLFHLMRDDVGAVGGSILTPPFQRGINATGRIEDVRTEPSAQWDYINGDREVDHLHCSFLYRAGIAEYDTSLSRIAHREETIFTYEIRRKGYKVMVTDCVTWHLRNKDGGIRTGDRSMFEKDEAIFGSYLRLWGVSEGGKKLVVLDNGIGDHYAFKSALPSLRRAYDRIMVAACYPEIFHDEDGLELISISDAINICGDIGAFSVYGWMERNKWKGSLTDAFLKMYE